MMTRLATGAIAIVLACNLGLADTPKAGTTRGLPLRGTIVSVDRVHKTITIETDGTKTEYTVDEATQFLGPKNGKADLGIKDGRVKQAHR